MIAHGYLRLVGKSGPTGVGVPCRYTIRNPADGVIEVDFAVPPEHAHTRMRITSRTGARHRHVPAIFNTDTGRAVVVLNHNGTWCQGRNGTFDYDFPSRTDDGWWCTPAFPGAHTINRPPAATHLVEATLTYSSEAAAEALQQQVLVAEALTARVKADTP